jgi:hypothetical protein
MCASNPQLPISDFVEHLLNKKLEMGAFSANENVVSLTKQTNPDQCERVRVN